MRGTVNATDAVEQAATLWPLAKARALKRKTLTHAEASAAIPGLAPEDVQQAAWPLHVWCWVRGMPPLNVVVVPKGTKAPPDGGFASTDYDVVHEALGRSVYTLEDAWFYPWTKVPDPTPEQLAAALAAHAAHHADLRAFRLLDLELDLRLRDEARGRKRPAPAGHATWTAAEQAHAAVAARLKAVGLSIADLRPPGKGPYPPPRPVTGIGPTRPPPRAAESGHARNAFADVRLRFFFRFVPDGPDRLPCASRATSTPSAAPSRWERIRIWLKPVGASVASPRRRRPPGRPAASASRRAGRLNPRVGGLV